MSCSNDTLLRATSRNSITLEVQTRILFEVMSDMVITVSKSRVRQAEVRELATYTKDSHDPTWPS